MKPSVNKPSLAGVGSVPGDAVGGVAGPAGRPHLSDEQ